MFWLEVKLNDGRVVYVNKGAIKMIEVLEKEEGRGQVGGEVNGQNKLKKQPGSG
jgi:Tfp pilus assembly protein PilP